MEIDDNERSVVVVDFLRLMPQKIPDCRVARVSGLVYQRYERGLWGKNRLKGDFLGFYA
jgi:hypothetical protein